MDNFLKQTEGLSDTFHLDIDMTKDRLSLVIPNFEDELHQIKEIASTGFNFAINGGFSGPEHFLTTFPKEWQEHYAKNAMWRMDPVFLWALAHNGNKRWSEISIPDFGNVMHKAKAFGLRFGAIFVRMTGVKKHLLSIARDDRELEDAEIIRLSDQFGRIIAGLEQRENLKPDELAVIRGVALGKCYQEISKGLNVSEATVKNRIRDIKTKLQAENLSHAVAIAYARGLI